MGLLQQIESGVYNNTPETYSSKSGLLNKVSHLDLTEHITFFDFLKKHSISYFAELEILRNSYFVSNSFGFDSKSIFSSYSSRDFWDGIIPECNHTYNFSSDDSSINQLLQLFSFELKEYISNIYVYKTSQSHILLFCSVVSILESSSLINDFNSISFSSSPISKSNKITISIDYSSALKDFVTNNIRNKFYLKKNIYNAIINEMKNRLYLYFHNFNPEIQFNDNLITLLLDDSIFSYKEILIKHLSSSFLDLFETENYKLKIQ